MQPVTEGRRLIKQSVEEIDLRRQQLDLNLKTLYLTTISPPLMVGEI
jgi:hypothetical protein